MMEYILIFANTLAALYFMFMAMSEEEGFIFSTKRLGWLLLILMLIIQLRILIIQADEKHELLRAAVEHNVTLPPIFKTQVYDTKLEIETEKIKGKLCQQSERN